MSGSWSRIAGAIAAVAAALAILGAVFSNGTELGSIGAKLDRNCRFLAAIQADERFLILEHEKGHDNETARAFAVIFKNAATASCG